MCGLSINFFDVGWGESCQHHITNLLKSCSNSLATIIITVNVIVVIVINIAIVISISIAIYVVINVIVDVIPLLEDKYTTLN